MEALGRLRNLAAGTEQSFKTDSQGMYTFANLPYGRYRLEVSRGGFATQSALIDVQSQISISRVLTMPLGAAVAQVDVIARTPLSGSGQSLREIPAPVQTATQQDIDAS